MKLKLGPLDLLTIIFVIAKLMGKLDWSWWAVLAPTWVPIVGVLGIVGFALVMAILAGKSR